MKPECGLTVREEPGNTPGTRRLVMGCPFAAAGLCPNGTKPSGTKLPVYGKDFATTDPQYQPVKDLVEFLADVEKAKCNGPTP